MIRQAFSTPTASTGLTAKRVFQEPSVDGPEEPRGVVLVETIVSIWIPVVEVLVLIWIQAWRKKILDDSGVRFSTREKES